MDGTMDEVLEQQGRSTVTLGTKNDSREDRGEDTVDDGIRALQGRFIVTVDTKSNKRVFRCMEQSDQLLPGIPDEVTLNQIVPKMQWKVFHILSLVRHGWQQAIQSHQVHDARVHSKSTDTFVVIDGNENVLLYSVRDKYYYQLPQIPNPEVAQSGSRSWKWRALDGRLYAIGGEYEEEYRGSPEVYVLDLAGQREWKECASMRDGRYNFGCGVMDGRIYVFGGESSGKPVHVSEVYNTEDNSWSAISPEISWRCDHDVAVLGEELVLFNGDSYDPEYRRATGRRCSAWFWEVYHPVKDERHIVRPTWEFRHANVFMSKGHFFVMIDDDLGIHIEAYDYDKKTWSQMHSASFAGIAGISSHSERYDMMVVNDELFVTVGNNDGPDLFLRSDGFGSDKKEILWKVENGCLPYDYFYFLCTIEL